MAESESHEIEEIDLNAPPPAAVENHADDDAGWDAPPDKPKAAPKEESGEDGSNDNAGDVDGQEQDDDAEWDESGKTEADDVPPEDRDPKGKVPSWRVREIKAAAAKEVEAAKAEVAAAKAELEKARSGSPALESEISRGQSHEFQQEFEVITSTDEGAKARLKTIDECQKWLAEVEKLAKENPSELTKYFANEDDMRLQTSKVSAALYANQEQLRSQIDQSLSGKRAAAAKAHGEYTTKLISDYDAAIKASAVPNIAKYAQRLAANAQRLHPEIRHLILSADDKDLVTAAVGSNRGLFDDLAGADPSKPLTPVQLARIGIKLGKAVGAYVSKPKGSYVDDQPEQRPVKTTVVRGTTRSPASVPKYRVEKDGTVII